MLFGWLPMLLPFPVCQGPTGQRALSMCALHVFRVLWAYWESPT